MKNLRAFRCVYKGPTDTRPSKVILTDLRFKKQVSFSYDRYEGNDVGDKAEQFLKSLGIIVEYQAENGNNGFLLLSENFETMIGSLKRNYYYP